VTLIRVDNAVSEGCTSHHTKSVRLINLVVLVLHHAAPLHRDCSCVPAGVIVTTARSMLLHELGICSSHHSSQAAWPACVSSLQGSSSSIVVSCASNRSHRTVISCSRASTASRTPFGSFFVCCRHGVSVPSSRAHVSLPRPVPPLVPSLFVAGLVLVEHQGPCWATRRHGKEESQEEGAACR
jgi:hypothetical protein